MDLRQILTSRSATLFSFYPRIGEFGTFLCARSRTAHARKPPSLPIHLHHPNLLQRSLSAFSALLPLRFFVNPWLCSSVPSVTLWQILILLALFRASLVHPYHLPRRRILLVQLRRFRDQLFHSRPLHVRHTPQLHVTYALSRTLQ